MTQEEVDKALVEQTKSFLCATISKPYKDQEYIAGVVGGQWLTTTSADPKSFNLFVGERDNSTSTIVGYLYDYLIDYDYNKRQWIPRIADFKVIVDEDRQTVRVEYTLRNDLYWSYLDGESYPVTSDDVIYWYDEIQGDKDFASSAYSSHFATTSKGEELPITIERIDDKRFAFNFPVMEADPLLATNMNFGPMKEFKEAKTKGGKKAVLDLFNVSCDITKIPSMGPYFIAEYIPSQRIVYKRNPMWWKKDINGISMTYPEKMVLQIVSDQNTQYLLFRQGQNETYSPRPEELDDIVYAQNEGYTIFNAQGGLSAPLWSFNQNPKNRGKAWQEWFCDKRFRQAMSCLLNRQRIIMSVYRGLAEPKYDFFPEFNTYYDRNITLHYKYDKDFALKLLHDAGFFQDKNGNLFDKNKVAVEFDLSVPAGSSIMNDIAQIIADECKSCGINVKVRQVDFQKMVEQLTATYDWQSIIIGLGSNLFPTQGSNVWPSNGNLHLWYPMQETPATEWEQRVDNLYNQGKACLDKAKAQKIWNEYQEIILEECPIIYLVRQKSFVGIRNKWDFANFYFDNMSGAITEHVFLRQ